ncbi:MAG: hypothetical protein PWP28_1519 [Oceanotoga sp.]|nr:hypothetical protein [Oceanotoga sp.]
MQGWGKMKYRLKTVLFILIMIIFLISILLTGFYSYKISKNALNEKGKILLKNSVKSAMVLAKEKYNDHIKKYDNEENAKISLENALSSIPSDQENDYYIIYDSKGNIIMHPEIKNQNAYNYSDAKNPEFKMVQKTIEIAKNGGGYIEYNWKYPKNTSIGLKISYAEYFEPWDLIITSTAYYSDFNKEAEKIKNYIIIFSIIFISLGIIYINNFSKKISKPIEKISKEMKNFDINLTKSYNSEKNKIKEIEEITYSYNKMVKQIKDSFDEIESMNEEIEDSYKENQKLMNKMENLISISTKIFQQTDKKNFLVEVFDNLFEFIPEADYGIISTVEQDRIIFLKSKGHDLKGLNSLKISINDYDFKKNVEIIKNTKTINKISTKYPQLPNHLKNIYKTLFIPIRTENKFYGNITLHTSYESKSNFTSESFRFAEFFYSFIKMFMTLKEFDEIETKTQTDIIISLIKMIEYKDKYTKGHSENVAKLAKKMAIEMNLPEKEIQKIYLAGLVHDIGKVLIKDEILNKPGKLTPEEFDEIKKHPLYAYEVLNKMTSMKEIAKIVKHHHERCDGKGYPDGLKCDQIPIYSKILSIVDTWDAMTSNRIYRNKLTKEQALEELYKCKKTQFDENIVEIFSSMIKKEES